MPRSRLFHPGRGPWIASNFRARQSTGIAPVATPPAAAPSALNTALASADQTVQATLRADWDRNSYLNSFAALDGAASEIVIESSATGNLPIEAGLVEGFASSQLTATLDGTLTDSSTQVVDALAPYRSDSALFRKALLAAPLTCDIGLATAEGPSSVRQFTGQVRSIRVDSGTRSAELVAADPAELLRAPITLPAYGVARSTLASAGNLFGVRTQAVIDFVLRRNGIYASPPPHPQAQISCTGHGWLAAEIGSNLTITSNLVIPVEDNQWWIPGPFNMLAVRGIKNCGVTQQFIAREQYSPTAGNGIGMSAWVYTGTDINLSSEATLFSLQPCVDSSYEFFMTIDTAGGLNGYVQGATSFAFVSASTTTAQWQYVGLHFKHNLDGTTTMKFRNNGVSSSGSGPTPAMTAAIAPFLTSIAHADGVSWSNFQVWYDPIAPTGSWPGEVHTSQADIDSGLNLMTCLPDVVNADSWTVIKDAAAAEYGLVGFTESGRFFFKDRNHATDPTSIEKTVTADTSLLSLAVTSSIDSVRNIFTTETTAGYMEGPKNTTTKPGQRIIDASDAAEFNSPAKSVTVWAVPLNYSETPLAAVNEVPHLTDAQWAANEQFIDYAYVAVNALSPATELTSGVTVLFLAAGDRLGWLVVYNTNSVPVQFSNITGTPAMRVVGYRRVDDPTVLNQVTDLSSIGTYGSRMLQIESSPYRQLSTFLEPVANALLAELKTPIPVLDDININGDPQLKLADTVRIVDPNTNGTMLASIVKIVRRFKNGQLTDTLSVRPVSSP